jgi:hypothetical protein
MRKWSGKAVARDAVDEVRDNVGEKGPSEKAGEVVVPVHFKAPCSRRFRMDEWEVFIGFGTSSQALDGLGWHAYSRDEKEFGNDAGGHSGTHPSTTEAVNLSEE